MHHPIQVVTALLEDETEHYSRCCFLVVLASFVYADARRSGARHNDFLFCSRSRMFCIYVTQGGAAAERDCVGAVGDDAVSCARAPDVTQQRRESARGVTRRLFRLARVTWRQTLLFFFFLTGVLM